MAKEKEEKKVKVEWKKPDTRADVEKLLMDNLKGFCTHGARAKNIGWFPTGHFNLDFAVRYGTLPINVDLDNYKDFNPMEPGGIPKGRIVEIYGETGGGKSSVCLRVVGAAQKKKKVCLWMDREQSFVESLAELNGVDLDDLNMVDKPGLSAEECFDLMYLALESGVDLIVVDSVSGLVPKAILDGTDSTKDTMALLARVMGKCVPKLASVAAKTGGTVIFINQIRQKPGVTYGNPEVTPGGETLKFYSSLRLQITKRYGEDAETYREDENGQQILIAQDSYAYIRKNRFSKNMKGGIPIPIYFEPFFPDPEERAFDLGRQTKLITTRTGTYTWKYGEAKTDRIDAEGRKAFIETLIAQNKVTPLIEAIKTAAAEQGALLPPELMLYKPDGKKTTKKKAAEQTEASRIINEYLETDADAPQEDAEIQAGIEEAKAEAALILGGKDAPETPRRGKKKAS